MYWSSFEQIYLQFCLDSSLSSFDTFRVLMFVCQTVSELRFYGCCNLCFIKSCFGLSLEHNYFYFYKKMKNVNVVLLLSVTSAFGCTDIFEGYSWQFHQVSKSQRESGQSPQSLIITYSYCWLHNFRDFD